MTALETLAASAGLLGLALRGAFHPAPGDGAPDLAGQRPAGTLVLLGFAGRGGWPYFARSPEASDGLGHPLDRWSRRVVGSLATSHSAEALFPFEGPPWHPFGRWAIRAEKLSPSPLGILIHPQWGLWHSYRGALMFGERLELAAPSQAPSPCTECREKPCLTACPVDAFSQTGFDAAACRDHLARPAGADCRTGGCLARRACPVGARHAYGADQAAFLMRAFLRSGA